MQQAGGPSPDSKHTENECLPAAASLPVTQGSGAPIGASAAELSPLANVP